MTLPPEPDLPPVLQPAEASESREDTATDPTPRARTPQPLPPVTLSVRAARKARRLQAETFRAERRRRIITLHNLGYSDDEIGRSLDPPITGSTVRDIFKRALVNLYDLTNREEAAKAELARLDAYERAWGPMAAGTPKQGGRPGEWEVPPDPRFAACLQWVHEMRNKIQHVYQDPDEAPVPEVEVTIESVLRIAAGVRRSRLAAAGSVVMHPDAIEASSTEAG